MKILSGTLVSDFEEAADLVCSESDLEDISLEAIELFKPLVDGGKLREEARRTIRAAIRNHYQSKPEWHGNWWYVPLPQPSYETRDTPTICFEVPIYLVAKARVETLRNYYNITLLGTLGHPQTLVLPLLFLESLLEENLGWIRIAGRSPGHTTYEIEGVKPFSLPDEFLHNLEAILKRKPVVDWLHTFSAQGRRISPLVFGSMLGMMFARKPPTVLFQNKQGLTPDQLVTILEGMAYTPKEARIMVNQGFPFVKPQMNKDEAVKIILKTAGKGG